MSPEAITTLLRVVLDSSLRACLLVGAVGAILVVARVRSGGVRHAAWAAVLGAMLAMPVLPYSLPRLEIPLSGRARAIQSIPAALESAWTENGPDGAQPAAAPSASETPPAAVRAVAPIERAPRVVWPFFLLGVYMAGALSFFTRLTLGWVLMRRTVRRADPIDGGTEGGRAQLGAHWRPPLHRVLQTAAVATPMTVGVLAPAILLPTAWRSWPEAKLRAVLAHELAHVRRRDPLVALLARVNLCLFWFHPVAWWLEKQLATTAEHACDDAGVRAMGENRGYAEVLLDMAEAARQAGGRLSWDGIGVHGSGLLGQRIDRVLSGELFGDISTKRKVVVAAACAAAVFVVAACRQEAAAPAPLKEDPAFAKEQAENKARSDWYESARQMTATQVAALQASLTRNPEDLDARTRLLVFAVPYGVPVPGKAGTWAPKCAQVIGEKECTAVRRTQILWLIEHHPDSPALRQYNGAIWPGGGHLNDPAGYEQARKLWLAQTARDGVTPAILWNAATFFQPVDQPHAEKLLLRAQAMDRDPRWSPRLGRFYGDVVGGRLAAGQSAAVNPPASYVEEVRRTLAASTDPRLLATAAWQMAYAPPPGSDELRAFAKTCAERAVQADPRAVQAHVVLVSLRDRERYMRMRQTLGTARPDQVDETRLAGLSETDRLDFLPSLASEAYSWGEYLESKQDGAGARSIRDRARKYAEEALRLAAKYPDNERSGTAIYSGNLVLAAVTFQAGNGPKAGGYLIQASKAPVNDDLRYSMPGPGLQFIGYMLKFGVREQVVEFLDRVGSINHVQGEYFRQQADLIRKGYRPLSYPRITRYYPRFVSE